EWSWITKPLRENKPIKDALTAFTDAGKKSHRAAVVWKNKDRREEKVLEANPADSLQTLELLAVIWALTNLPDPLNVVTDSLYVAGVVQRIEDASIKEVQNRRLYELFL
ncbi:POK6 protein, partial [Erpornis zantholeuca]|nr:POK6 protein [Erpornis zantholeuca]